MITYVPSCLGKAVKASLHVSLEVVHLLLVEGSFLAQLVQCCLQVCQLLFPLLAVAMLVADVLQGVREGQRNAGVHSLSHTHIHLNIRGSIALFTLMMFPSLFMRAYTSYSYDIHLIVVTDAVMVTCIG